MSVPQSMHARKTSSLHKAHSTNGSISRFLLSNRRILHGLLAAVQLPFLPVYLIVLVGYCLVAGIRRRRRHRAGAAPQLVWGPDPIQSTVEIGRALKPAGLRCDTIVYYNYSRIWKADTFTYCLTDDLVKYPWAIAQFLRVVFYHYKVFLRVVRDYDVVHGWFYGGFLRYTLFEHWEAQLLHLAGCKQVTTSIGGDIAVMTDIDSHVIRQGMNDMYPFTTSVHEQDRIRRWIRYWSLHSDFIICQCAYNIDVLPRWDLLTTQYFPIDTDFWQGNGYGDADGQNAPVTIGHSSNHRPLKGTNFLIRAVNELRAEGLKIELVLLENHQNTEVRDILREVDIVVADVILQGYAVMACEGCSLGKPVVQDISDPHLTRVFRLYTGLDEAPFVSGPVEELKENLRKLIVNPALRKEIGMKSRAYAMKYHSHEAMRKFWLWVYEYVWYARRDRVAFYHPDWPLETLTSLNQIVATEHDVLLTKHIEPQLAAYRGADNQGRIAFSPLNERTIPLVRNLIRNRVIRSSDYLVADDDVQFRDPGRTQSIVAQSDLAAYGVSWECVLPDSTDWTEQPQALSIQMSRVSVDQIRQAA